MARPPVIDSPEPARRAPVAADPFPIAVEIPADIPIPASATPLEPVSAREPRGPMSPWLLRGAIAAAAVAALAAGGSYLLRGFGAARDKVTTLATSAKNAAGDKPAPLRTTGSLKVTSTPDGARVVIDGKDRGLTPLALDDLTFGTHTVAIEGKTGSVQRSVAITPDAVAQLDERIFDGWVAVFSPIEVVISEGNRVLRPDDRSEIMLPPGTHRLRVTNRTLAYDDVQSILVKPGEKTAFNVTPPKSSVSVSASDAAEVFLDGARIGTTPVNGVPAAIGSHELVVRRASGGEKRMPITVTVKPFTIAVDF